MKTNQRHNKILKQGSSEEHLLLSKEVRLIFLNPSFRMINQIKMRSQSQRKKRNKKDHQRQFRSLRGLQLQSKEVFQIKETMNHSHCLSQQPQQVMREVHRIQLLQKLHNKLIRLLQSSLNHNNLKKLQFLLFKNSKESQFQQSNSKFKKYKHHHQIIRVEILESKPNLIQNQLNKL